MKFSIKKEINLYNKDININFIYNVKYDSFKKGFKDFDIDNENIIIDSTLYKINNNKKQIENYYSLVDLLFKNTNADEIKIEDDKTSVILGRKDL